MLGAFENEYVLPNTLAVANISARFMNRILLCRIGQKYFWRHPLVTETQNAAASNLTDTRSLPEIISQKLSSIAKICKHEIWIFHNHKINHRIHDCEPLKMLEILCDNLFFN